MTISEVNRYIDSRIRIFKVEQKQKASFDYTLASLIAQNISVILDKKNKTKSIEEVYPDIFVEEKTERDKKIKEQKMIMSALRFKQFAQHSNNKFKKEVQTGE